MAEHRQRGFTNERIEDVTEEETDDFIVIDIDKCSDKNVGSSRAISESSNGSSSSSPSNSLSSKSTSPGKSNDIDSGIDYDEYVEVTYDDVMIGDKTRSEEQKRSLYGVRLFQYSPESEGNIYITNEEL